MVMLELKACRANELRSVLEGMYFAGKALLLKISRRGERVTVLLGRGKGNGMEWGRLRGGSAIRTI